MKARSLLLALCAVCSGAAWGQEQAPDDGMPLRPGDRPWGRIQLLIDAAPGIINLASSKNPASLDIPEVLGLELRDRGRSFYGTYADDPRRLAWLPYAMAFRPTYQTNRRDIARARLAAPKGEIPAPLFDEAARAEWDKVYPALRKEYMESAGSTPTGRALLLTAELNARLRPLFTDSTLGALYDDSDEGRELRAGFRREILEIGSLPADWKQLDAISTYNSLNDVRFMADQLLDAYWIAGDEAPVFIGELKQTVAPRLLAYAAGKSNLLQLAKEPMRARFTTMDGRQLDLQKLQGKVVLLQYWSSSCIGCIRKIPMLEKIYGKYHDKGFEIIGYSHDRDPGEVTRLLQRRNLKAPWPHRVDRELYKDYQKYGFVWVSNLLLLDKSGRLVSHCSDLTEAQLENLIRKYLGTVTATATDHGTR